MTQKDNDFRHRMDCGDCWARQYEPGVGSLCLISKQNDNRPEGIPEDKTRDSYSRVYDGEILDRWPCEFRYTRKELRMMKFGEYHTINVSKTVALKIIQAAESIPGFPLIK